MCPAPCPGSPPCCWTDRATKKFFLRELDCAFLSRFGLGSNVEHPLPYSISSHFSDWFLEKPNQKLIFLDGSLKFLISSKVLNVSPTLKCQLGKKYCNPESLPVSAPHFMRDPLKIRPCFLCLSHCL